MRGYEEIPATFNVAAHFLDGNLAAGRGERTAIVCGEKSYSYAAVAALTNRIGNVLAEMGVRREQRVLIALGESVEFVATWYAVLKLGAVVADVYTFLQPKDYEYYLRYSGAEVAVVDALTLPALRQARQAVPGLRSLLVSDVPQSDLAAQEWNLQAAVAQASEELEAAPTSRDDIAIWKFTTGSTGAPKAAVHCAHDPLISFESYALGVLGYTEDDVVLPVPKMFFGYARDATTLFTFGVGATGVIFPERSTPDLMFELIERHRPTIVVQVPTMMNAMVRHPEADRYDLSCVRFCISSGEALPEELYRRWMDRFGVEVLDGIGSSEAYHIYISNRPGAVRPGSVGQLVPGYGAQIVDGEGRECEPGEPGELWVTGESAALMYWQDHQKSKRTFAGDLIRTGDLFATDEDGYFFYRGRADDLLKVGGIWVAPLEIENCLLMHEAVAECAVVGYQQDGLTRSRAYVVLESHAAPSRELAAELQDFVRQRLSPHKYPRDVHFAARLPKTASDKVDRKALREMVGENAAAAAAARREGST